jgi:hypothetical protein
LGCRQCAQGKSGRLYGAEAKARGLKLLVLALLPLGDDGPARAAPVVKLLVHVLSHAGVLHADDPARCVCCGLRPGAV